MRVAIPVDDRQFCPHFGRSSQMMLAEVDPATRTVERKRIIDRPQRGCDSFPQWLSELAVDMVVGGGMGAGAQQGLANRGIGVSLGHDGDDLDAVIASFLDHPEGLGNGACSHDDHEHQHCRH